MSLKPTRAYGFVISLDDVRKRLRGTVPEGVFYLRRYFLNGL